ncbi:MAG: response regulator [Acidobacteria bacterium]|jgi:CheY-like chemotaxis protein|nr:response regulator [Acidobacteriota bacterium]
MATILIADDSTTIRKVVQSVLGAAGHTVVGATQGREALELARGRRPDLVLCDVLMPELTGYEVAEALRRDPTLRGVPIVLLFGAFEPFDEDRAARCGAVGHLAKPFEPRQLLRRVEELLLASPPAPPPEPTPDAPPAAELAPPPEPLFDAPLDLPPPWDARVPLPGDDEFDLVPAPVDAASVPDLEAAIRDEVRRRLEELAPEIVREVAWEVVPDLLERLLRESAAAPRRPAEPTGDATR